MTSSPNETDSNNDSVIMAPNMIVTETLEDRSNRNETNKRTVTAVENEDICVESEEDKSNFFSILYYTWMNPLFKAGFKRPLERADLFRLGPSIQSNTIATAFEKCWSEEISTRPSHPNIYRVLLKSVGREFYLGGVFRLIGDLSLVAAPVLLLEITAFITAPSSLTASEPWYGYVMAVALFILQFLQAIFVNRAFEHGMRFGFVLRTCLTSAIFQKSLRLSSHSRQIFPAGRIVNIMSTDINRLDIGMQFIHYLWTAPIQLLIAFGLLYWQLGISALVALAIIACSVPLQYYGGKQLGVYRTRISQISDTRVKVQQEALSGIKVIKLYAWEDAFFKTISALRSKEVFGIRLVMLLRAVLAGYLQTVPIIAGIVTLIVFTALDNTLTTTKAFATLSLVYVLRIPLLIYPQAISTAVDSQVALSRIREILTSEELDSEPVRISPSERYKNHFAIRVSKANFIWDGVEEKRTSQQKLSAQPSLVGDKFFTGLHDIDFEIKKGELVAIVGAVGSGKSSLVNALIGEMKRSAGQVEINGSLAFCANPAWIQNLTLRDNILFGNPFDETKYREVLKVCALESDLKVLAGGDMTEIGEKGINLSGGQKQRVNLARAVYTNSDIILMDDPLSAVDAHVGTYLFEKCICEALGQKTRLLVTHRLHILSQCDRIIVLDQGRVAEMGSFDELMGRNGQLARMMHELEPTSSDNSHHHGVASKKSLTTKVHSEQVQISGQKTDDSIKADTAIAHPGQKVEGTTLIAKEDRTTGTLAGFVITGYLKMAGGYLVWLGMIFVLLLAQASRIVNDSWLSIWIQTTIPGWEQWQYRTIYGGLGVIQCFLMIVSGMLFAFACTMASARMHDSAFKKVLASPMAWFDSQPLGRIMNRLSRDVDNVDSLLSDAIRVFLFTFSMTLSIFIYICVVFPFYLVPLVPIIGLYYFIQYYYRRTSLELKRLDNVSRSPLFALFSESLAGAGLSTIRAYGAQGRFIARSKELLDYNNRAYYLVILAQRWLSLRLDTLASALVFFAALLGVILYQSVDPNLIALSITYSLQVTFILNYAVRQATETEMQLNSVERLLDYKDNLPTEESSDSAESIPSNDIELKQVKVSPPESWPAQGEVKINGLVLRYRADLPDVLKGVDFNVKPGEKVGIVGRTGAGKSSLIYALFLLTKPVSGSVVIDGIDITQIPLKDLRKKLSIIPQDPVIFSGTLRDNFDPFNEYADERINQVVKICGLESSIDPVLGIKMPVTENGDNFSTGQRQLICLGRAMLRNSKILILDEATASVDMATDSFIQKSLREHFSKCTILTIAHRLNTIMDYDKIVVMGNGAVIEVGSPNELMEKKGVFWSMVQDQTQAESQ